MHFYGLSPRRGASPRRLFEPEGREAGAKTAKTHGHDFYQEIGHKGGEKGGQKVKRLIEEGREAEEKK